MPYQVERGKAFDSSISVPPIIFQERLSLLVQWDTLDLRGIGRGLSKASPYSQPLPSCPLPLVLNMPVRRKDDSIARSMMLLCLGTAGMLAVAQWQMRAGRFDVGNSQMVAPSQRERSQQSLVVLKQSFQPSNPPDSQTAVNSTLTPLEAKSETSKSETVTKTDSRVVVSLSERRVQVYHGSQLLNSYAIAVAKPGWETPTGTFKVLEMERNPTWVHPITGMAIPPGNDNPLGAAWIGFLSNEEGEIGFHGTNQEELIGEAVSHGCLRMRNEDVKALYSYIATGTPVIVEQ